MIDSEHVTWCGVSRVWRGLPLVGEMSRDPQLASDWLRTAVTREVTITWAEECMNCVGRSVTPTTPGTLCHFRHPAQWPAASSGQTRSCPIAAAGAGPGAPDAIDLVIGPAASLQRLIISSFTLLQPLPLFQPRRMTIQN